METAVPVDALDTEILRRFTRAARKSFLEIGLKLHQAKSSLRITARQRCVTGLFKGCKTSAPGIAASYRY